MKLKLYQRDYTKLVQKKPEVIPCILRLFDFGVDWFPPPEEFSAGPPPPSSAWSVRAAALAFLWHKNVEGMSTERSRKGSCFLDEARHDKHVTWKRWRMKLIWKPQSSYPIMSANIFHFKTHWFPDHSKDNWQSDYKFQLMQCDTIQ